MRLSIPENFVDARYVLEEGRDSVTTIHSVSLCAYHRPNSLVASFARCPIIKKYLSRRMAMLPSLWKSFKCPTMMLITTNM